MLSGHATASSPPPTRPTARASSPPRRQTARIWDARSDAQLAVLTGHGDRVHGRLLARWHPHRHRLVDKTARIWDAHSGAQLAVLKGHEDIVYSAAYSPDGTRIVTASFDKTARIWDAASGAQLAVLAGHGGWVLSAAYSPDGTRIVTASLTRPRGSGTQAPAPSSACSPATAPSSNRRLLARRHAHRHRVRWTRPRGSGTRAQGRSSWCSSAMAIRPFRGLFARWRTSSPPRLTRPHGSGCTHRTQLVVLSGHGGQVRSAAYSPDGTRIVTASTDKTARIWDARTGEQLAVLSGHAGCRISAAYSPDGTRIVTASHDKTARIWDADSGAQLLVLSGHGGRS